MRKGANILVFLSVFFTFKALFSFEVGFVDMKRVKDQYMDLQEAKKELQRYIRNWSKKADSLKALIDSAKVRYEREKLMMTDEARLLREKQIQELKNEYQRYWKSIWGKGGKVEQQTKILIEPLIKKMHEVIYQIAHENGYDLVLDVSSDVILYTSGKNDITEDVINELNREYASVHPQSKPGIKPKLAIFPLKEENQAARERSLGQKLAQYLTAGFRSSPKFEVVSSGKISSEMQRLGINTENITQVNAFNMAQDLQVDLFIYGTVKITGEEVDFKVMLYSVLDNRLLVQETGKSRDREAELSVAAQNIAHLISQKYKP